MESIVRVVDKEKKLTLDQLYANIQTGKSCPEFYRKTNLLLNQKEYLLMETLGQGRMGFVFLAYCQRKLIALKLSYETQESDSIFSTIKRSAADDYRHYFLQPQGGSHKLDSLSTMDSSGSKRIAFECPVYATAWEPADRVVSDGLEENFETKKKWFTQFIIGLNMIHQRRRAHFDIKLENLFIVDGRLKIGDFEFYAKIDDFIHSDILLCGTPGHIAPEMFYDRQHITPKIDIFSSGIAFARLFLGLTSQEAFAAVEGGAYDLSDRRMGLEQLPVGKKILKDKDFQLNYKIYFFYKCRLIEKTKQSTLQEKEIYDLLLRMIELVPSRRPNAAELITLPGAGSPATMSADKESTGMEAVYKVQKPEPATPKMKREIDQFTSLEAMLETHDKCNAIKYSFMPDLISKLIDDKIKERIGDIEFSGDDYRVHFFSFVPQSGTHDNPLLLFGRNISTTQVRTDRDWNMLVILDYWNRIFKMGFEADCTKKIIEGVLNGRELASLQSVFEEKIKSTRKLVLKLWKKNKE